MQIKRTRHLFSCALGNHLFSGAGRELWAGKVKDPGSNAAVRKGPFPALWTEAPGGRSDRLSQLGLPAQHSAPCVGLPFQPEPRKCSFFPKLNSPNFFPDRSSPLSGRPGHCWLPASFAHPSCLTAQANRASAVPQGRAASPQQTGQGAKTGDEAGQGFPACAMCWGRPWAA